MRRSGLCKLMLIATVMSLLIVSLAACGGEETTTTAAPTVTTAAPSTETTAAPSTETTAGSPATAEPIKIGVLLDLTGFLAWTGTDNQKGMELCVEMAGGQVAGRPIQLVIEDAATDGAVAMDKAKKLVETDKVCIVLGPVNGMGDLAITGYMEEKGLPRIELAPTEEVVAGGGYKWNFMPHGCGMMYGFAVADYAYKDLGYRSLAGLGADMDAGKTFLGGFLTAFRNLGGTVPYETYYAPGTTDFLPFFASMPKVDAVATWWPGTDGLSGFPQYQESGLKYPMIQPEDGGLTADPKALKDLPSAAGCVAGTLYTYLLNTPGNVDFVKAYEAKQGMKPGVFAGCGYASMQYVLAALEAAGGDTTPAALQAALKGVSVDTICGPVSFPVPENNIAAGRIVIMKVSEQLEPETIKTVRVQEAHDAAGKPVLTIVK
ncbi:MAG: ABC transporter substrate-binding protein [Actinomycetia bacterium]|nr:ABC transporter substrate-binding protein [Actinomycetes bacterium]